MPRFRDPLARTMQRGYILSCGVCDRTEGTRADSPGRALRAFQRRRWSYDQQEQYWRCLECSTKLALAQEATGARLTLVPNVYRAEEW